MSTDLTRAIADVRQAEAQAAQIAQILAVVQAAQAAQAAPAAPAACSCSHHAPARRSGGKTAAVVAAGAAGVCVLTGMFLAIALAAVAVGVSATVLYLLWREIRKGK
ncbi:hypothetical protein [Streptomyces lannensis]|uniref:Uncharacterized protein n=1 Tax=Streptomyces lannensis TaxID=766498 RepID=A0ABP7LWS5_9ACTN